MRRFLTALAAISIIAIPMIAEAQNRPNHASHGARHAQPHKHTSRTTVINKTYNNTTYNGYRSYGYPSYGYGYGYGYNNYAYNQAWATAGVIAATGLAVATTAIIANQNRYVPVYQTRSPMCYREPLFDSRGNVVSERTVCP
jgi:hypothetical protein